MCQYNICFLLDGNMRVPQDVLQKAHQDLHSLRMSIFKLLQPKLQCNLGKLQMHHITKNSEETLGKLTLCHLTYPQENIMY